MTHEHDENEDEDLDNLDDADDQAGDDLGEIPEGAALFPSIPPELGVNPLLAAVLHAYVFLAGSSTDIVHPAAGSEALEYIAEYLQRLQGQALTRVQEDLRTLIALAKQEKWPKEQIRFLRSFLEECGQAEIEEA